MKLCSAGELWDVWGGEHAKLCNARVQQDHGSDDQDRRLSSGIVCFLIQLIHMSIGVICIMYQVGNCYSLWVHSRSSRSGASTGESGVY